VTRRPVLPGAAELFRRTDTPAVEQPVIELPTLAAAQSSPALRGSAAQQTPADGEAPAPDQGAGVPSMPLSLVRAGGTGGAPARRDDDELAGVRAQQPAAAPRVARGRTDSGRTRHAEKITVYCSPEELLSIEAARLCLRGEHGVVADRGRIVREAVAVLLADLDERGEDSILVRRLRRS
jgi:hypothetical protein